MLLIALAVLVILWLIEYIHIPGILIPSYPLFIILGKAITLWDILMFFAVVLLIGLLPSPFREITAVLFILWILSIFGIFSFLSFALLPEILIIAIIIGLIGFLFVNPKM